MGLTVTRGATIPDHSTERWRQVDVPRCHSADPLRGSTQATSSSRVVYRRLGLEQRHGNQCLYQRLWLKPRRQPQDRAVKITWSQEACGARASLAMSRTSPGSGSRCGGGSERANLQALEEYGGYAGYTHLLGRPKLRSTAVVDYLGMSNKPYQSPTIVHEQPVTYSANLIWNPMGRAERRRRGAGTAATRPSTA